MLTVHVDDDHLFDALRAGARGYLVKGTPPDQMLDRAAGGAPRRAGALTGHRDADPGALPGHGEPARARARPRVRRALPREAEVLDLLRQGLSTSLIAQRLYVSPVTVRSHIATTLKKLNVADRERRGAGCSSLTLVTLDLNPRSGQMGLRPLSVVVQHSAWAT